MNERTRFTSWASVFESSWLVIGLKWTSDQNVPMFLLRLHEISRGREKIVPFSDSTSLRDWYNLSAFFSTNLFLFSRHHIPTNSVASISAYKPTHNQQFLQSLWRRANARNVSFFILYGGHVVLFGVRTENEGHCETGISRNSFCGDLARLFHVILFLVRKFYGHYLNGSPTTRTGATRQTRIPDLKKTMTNLDRWWTSENREINFILWSVWLAVLFAYGVRFETSAKKRAFQWNILSPDDQDKDLMNGLYVESH